MAASATPSAARARSTATFEEYYWEAYNEIVHPSRFDWYLVTHWLPELGPEGFAIVKALRSRCYFNPKEGTLRNTCEISMDELAAMVGMKRSTLYREFERNEALGRFVQQQHQYVYGEKRPQRHNPQFLVCMDDPIHPRDQERYEALRRQKEQERQSSEGGRARKFTVKPKSQNGINDLPKSQFETPKSQFETPKSQNGILYKEESLPPEGLYTKDLFTNPADSQAPSHKCSPPEGDRHAGRDDRHGCEHSCGISADVVRNGKGNPPDPLLCVWESALLQLAGLVHKPTFEAHIRTLRPLALDGNQVTLACPSAFTREWIVKRHEGHLQEALASVLGEGVQVRLVLEAD